MSVRAEDRQMIRKARDRERRAWLEAQGGFEKVEASAKGLERAVGIEPSDYARRLRLEWRRHVYRERREQAA